MGDFKRAIDFFAHCEADRLLEDRPGEGEGVELAIFAAWVDVGRERIDEGLIDAAPDSFFVKIRVVDAADDGAEAHGDEFADQFAGIDLPDGKNSAHANEGEVLFSPELEVFKEDVAEDAGRDALRFMSQQAGRHSFLIFLIRTALADEDFLEGKADGGGLQFEQLKPHSVHGDALEVLVAGGEESHYFVAIVGEDAIQGER